MLLYSLQSRLWEKVDQQRLQDQERKTKSADKGFLNKVNIKPS